MTVGVCVLSANPDAAIGEAAIAPLGRGQGYRISTGCRGGRGSGLYCCCYLSCPCLSPPPHPTNPCFIRKRKTREVRGVLCRYTPSCPGPETGYPTAWQQNLLEGRASFGTVLEVVNGASFGTLQRGHIQPEGGHSRPFCLLRSIML